MIMVRFFRKKEEIIWKNNSSMVVKLGKSGIHMNKSAELWER